MTIKITEEYLNNNNEPIDIWDRFGNKHRIIKYTYPVTKEFIDCVKPLSYNEQSSHYGESILILNFDNDKESCVADNDYFDIIDKHCLRLKDLKEYYYVSKPTEEEIKDNQIDILETIMKRFLENLKELMIDNAIEIDRKLYDYEKILDDQNKLTNQIKDNILSISKDCNNIIEKVDKLEDIR